MIFDFVESVTQSLLSDDHRGSMMAYKVIAWGKLVLTAIALLLLGALAVRLVVWIFGALIPRIVFVVGGLYPGSFGFPFFYF